MPEAPVLRVTTEELSLLQRSLDIDKLPGIVPDLLAELNEEQKKQAWISADHTLRARGLVGWDGEQQHRINPGLAEILLDYSSPNYTLFVDTCVALTRAIPFLYVFGKQAIYEQCQPEPDVLQFTIFSDRQELVRRLLPDLRQTEPAGAVLEGIIYQSVLNQGLKVVRQNEHRARQIFLGPGTLPPFLAEGLAAAYHEPQIVQYMARFKHQPAKEQPQPEAALTILQAQHDRYLLWVAEPEKGEAAAVIVQQMTQDVLSACIGQVIPPFTLA